MNKTLSVSKQLLLVVHSPGEQPHRVNKQLLLVIYSPGEQNSQGEQTITIGRLYPWWTKLSWWRNNYYWSFIALVNKLTGWTNNCYWSFIVLVNKTHRVNKQLLLVVYIPGEQNSQGEQTITIGRLYPWWTKLTGWTNNYYWSSIALVNKTLRVNKQLLLVIYSPGGQNSQGEQTITICHL